MGKRGERGGGGAMEEEEKGGMEGKEWMRRKMRGWREKRREVEG